VENLTNSVDLGLGTSNFAHSGKNRGSKRKKGNDTESHSPIDLADKSTQTPIINKSDQGNQSPAPKSYDAICQTPHGITKSINNGPSFRLFQNAKRKIEVRPAAREFWTNTRNSLENAAKCRSRAEAIQKFLDDDILPLWSLGLPAYIKELPLSLAKPAPDFAKALMGAIKEQLLEEAAL